MLVSKFSEKKRLPFPARFQFRFLSFPVSTPIGAKRKTNGGKNPRDNEGCRGRYPALDPQAAQAT